MSCSKSVNAHIVVTSNQAPPVKGLPERFWEVRVFPDWTYQLEIHVTNTSYIDKMPEHQRDAERARLEAKHPKPKEEKRPTPLQVWDLNEDTYLMWDNSGKHDTTGKCGHSG